LTVIKATAVEAYTRDVVRSIVRLDPKSIEEMGLSGGGIIELRGASATAAKCLPLYPSDWNHKIARMDALLRYNAGVSTGDQIEARKVSASAARRVLLTPLGERFEVTNFFIKHWQESDEPVESRFAAGALSGTPVVNGDIVMVEYQNYRLFFLILEKEPLTGPSVVGRGTKIELVPWLTAST
jgi:transitional endoplasmic reticulum ATPase